MTCNIFAVVHLSPQQCPLQELFDTRTTWRRAYANYNIMNESPAIKLAEMKP